MAKKRPHRSKPDLYGDLFGPRGFYEEEIRLDTPMFPYGALGEPDPTIVQALQELVDARARGGSTEDLRKIDEAISRISGLTGTPVPGPNFTMPGRTAIVPASRGFQGPEEFIGPYPTEPRQRGIPGPVEELGRPPTHRASSRPSFYHQAAAAQAATRGPRAPTFLNGPAATAASAAPWPMRVGAPRATAGRLAGLGARLGSGLGMGLTGLGAAASAYAIYDLLDEYSGASRAREAYTPEAWQGRYMQAYDQRDRMLAQMDAESTNSLMDRTATQAESLHKVGDVAMKAYRDQAMAPTKRSMDKLEALLGPDLDTVKQVSQQSPPSFADFAAGEGIL